MTLGELLAEIVRGLDAAGIPHMVAGSIASTHHGEPRSTQDVDLVIDPTESSLDTFVTGLDRDRFYVGDASGAFERRDQFNVIDVTTGWKVDLIICRDRPFSRVEFDRRTPVVIAGVRTAVATVEDTILTKLEWARAGGSERQRRDVVAMLTVQRGRIDTGYLRQWAAALAVRDELDAVMAEAAGESMD
ncbi:MAG TPA: hypothetical protein VI854_01865 [Acidimicrobiia bacterium]|nr:hypothetical protein [Acidimicrobiia bacterium]